MPEADYGATRTTAVEEEEIYAEPLQSHSDGTTRQEEEPTHQSILFSDEEKIDMFIKKHAPSDRTPEVSSKIPSLIFCYYRTARWFHRCMIILIYLHLFFVQSGNGNIQRSSSRSMSEL